MTPRLMLLLIITVVLSEPAAAGWNPIAALDGWQKPNMKVGQLELHPYYGISVLYDDNIYLAGRDKADGTRTGCFPGIPSLALAASAAGCSGGVRGAIQTINNLGIKFALPLGSKHKFTAGYDFTSTDYSTQHKANDAVAQSANGSYDFKGAAVSARAWSNFVNTEDPAFNPNNTISGELVERKRRWQNTSGVSSDYSLGDKFYIGIDGQFARHKYREPSLAALLDRSETTFGGRVGYKVQPKTKVYVAVHRGLFHYSAVTANNPAANHVRIANHKDWYTDLGVEGQLTGKIKGKAEAGYNYRAYDADNQVSNQKPVKREAQFKAQLNYKLTPRNDVNLNANRGLNEGVSGGRFYTSTGASLEGTHSWSKLLFAAKGGVQVDKYSEAITLPTVAQGGGYTANRRDDLYTVGLKIDYKMQEWLLTGVSYQHKARFSIFSDQFNYKDNQTSWMMKVTF